MTMPFGKHYGEEVSDLSDSYLRWLAEEAEVYDEDLAAEIQAEYEERGL